jgi:hypothetical protein
MDRRRVAQELVRLAKSLLDEPKKTRHRALPRKGYMVRDEEGDIGKIINVEGLGLESDEGDYVVVKVKWHSKPGWDYAYWDNLEHIEDSRELEASSRVGSDESQAEQMGKKGYHKGIKAPALDKGFMSFLEASDSEALDLLKAYNKGWTDEHMKESDRKLREMGFFD